MSTANAVTPSQLFEMMKKILPSKLVPMIHSDPGLGKSDIVKSLAKYFNLKLIDIRLATVDPVYLNGVLTANQDKTKGTFLPLDNIPVEGDEIPTGYKGWSIFFDEITQAPPAVQSAAYKIILDKQVGDHKIHKNVLMAAAGNLVTSGAIAHKSNTAIQSRMLHFALKADHKSWTDWAEKNDIDHRVLSYIRFRPEFLHKFDAKHSDLTFPCPRTWSFLSQWAKDIDDQELVSMRAAITGTVGEAAGNDYVNFVQVYQKLPTVAEIIADPVKAKVPNEVGSKFAASGMLAQALVTHKEPAARTSLLTYLQRLDIQFQVIAMRQAVPKDMTLMRSQYVTDFAKQNKELLNFTV